MNDITITLSREVFEDCLISVPGFRRYVIEGYSAMGSSMAVPETIHKGLLRLLGESLSNVTESGFDKIKVIKAIREDSGEGRMQYYYLTFPGFFTGSNINSMGLADAKKLAEHYILHFGNQFK